MIPVPADSITYDTFEIFGYQGLFTNLRVDRNTLPEGLYAYDLRDEFDGNINQLKDKVIVNHWGTVILKTQITDADKGVTVTSEDYGFLGDSCTIEDYLSGNSIDV